jgi:hypothetical protein
MQSTASIISIFLLWLVGLAVIVYLFLPPVQASLSSMQTYNKINNDSELKKQMDIGDRSYTSFSPLAIFDFL